MNRNEPCRCGSGSKYKHCCEEKDRRRSGGVVQWLLIALIPLAIGAVIWTLVHSGDEPVTTEQPVTTDAPLASSGATNPIGVPGPQPEGPVPPGKVWSEEHGHWHDAAPVQIQGSGVGSGLSATVGSQAPPVVSQTPADAPEDGEVDENGRVWSAAHNHWHDPEADSTSQASRTAVPRSQIPRVSVRQDGTVTSTNLVPQPAGEAPEGKVWSPEHGHWHDKPTFPSGETEEDDTPQR